jgi:type II secretory ATPase GspE/PulE/Tfp pilus assembly ATPase PilB-like protein
MSESSGSNRHSGGVQRVINVDEVISPDASPSLVWDAVVSNAVIARVSDIHCLAAKDGYHLAYRIDGDLRRQGVFGGELGRRLINHVKSIAGMDVGEYRRPTEGRLKTTVEDRSVDMRISCVPSIHGQDMVVRIFDHTVQLMEMEELGLIETQINHLRDMIGRPNGLILVCGGSGSGKTTTLYAMLRELTDTQRKIITIENPVEFDLDGVNQTEVNPRINVHFADLLRAILRQDPDVIMVGEIRDQETATTAVRAANTGHLVLATIHATTASRAVESMLSLGVHPYFFNIALRCVIAQVLVKRICPECKVELPETGDMIIDQTVRSYLDEDSKRDLAQGKGCDHCFNTGYRGRIGLFELFIPDDEVRQLILQEASADRLDRTAAKSRLLSLEQAGKLAAVRQLTTMEEIVDALPMA